MPAKAKMEERLRWHLEHARNCGCRPIPDGVAEEMKQRGMFPPDRRNPLSTYCSKDKKVKEKRK